MRPAETSKTSYCCRQREGQEDKKNVCCFFLPLICSAIPPPLTSPLLYVYFIHTTCSSFINSCFLSTPCAHKPSPFTPGADASGQVIVTIIAPWIVKEIRPGVETVTVDHASGCLRKQTHKRLFDGVCVSVEFSARLTED